MNSAIDLEEVGKEAREEDARRVAGITGIYD